jgi:asparagine synthetase A
MLNNNSKIKNSDLATLKLCEEKLIEYSMEKIRNYESEYLISREKRNLKILKSITRKNFSLTKISKRYDIDKDYVIRIYRLFVLKARDITNSQ